MSNLDTLLDELRQLAAAYPADAGVREMLAEGVGVRGPADHTSRTLLV